MTLDLLVHIHDNYQYKFTPASDRSKKMCHFFVDWNKNWDTHDEIPWPMMQLYFCYTALILMMYVKRLVTS